jgi:hypothetical protein
LENLKIFTAMKKNTQSFSLPDIELSNTDTNRFASIKPDKNNRVVSYLDRKNRKAPDTWGADKFMERMQKLGLVATWVNSDSSVIHWLTVPGKWLWDCMYREESPLMDMVKRNDKRLSIKSSK